MNLLAVSRRPVSRAERRVNRRRRQRSFAGVERLEPRALLASDTTPPTIVIYPSAGPTQPSGSIGELTVAPSEHVAGLSSEDVRFSFNGKNVALDGNWWHGGVSGVGPDYFIGPIAPQIQTGTYTISIPAAGSGIVDAAGNTLANDAAFTWQVNGADLSGQSLTGRDFAWYDFTGANFTSANLSGSSLRGTTLRNANLTDANLTNVELRDADLTGARYSQFTVWPAGFDPVAAGAVLGPPADIDIDTTRGVVYVTGASGTAVAFRSAFDAAGNSIIAGSFTGTVDFDPGVDTTALSSVGGQDGFVAKYSPQRTLLWVRRIGGAGEDRVNSVAMSGSGEIYFGGRFDESATITWPVSTGLELGRFLTSSGGADAFVGSFANDGAVTWIDAYGGSQFDEINALAIQPDGNVVAVGSFDSTVDFDRGAASHVLTTEDLSDVFVLSLAPSGEYRWVRQFAGSGYQYPRAAAVGADGSIAITGSFYGTVDFDPGVGQALLTATPGYTSAFVVKLDAGGSLSWAGNLAGTMQFGESIAVDSFGSVYAAGVAYGDTDFALGPSVTTRFYGGTRVYLVKYDATGSYQWVRTFASSSLYGSHLADRARGSVEVDSSGCVYLAGGFSGTVDFDDGTASQVATASGSEDAYLLKWRAGTGELQAVRTFGGSGADRADGIALNPFGQMLVNGVFATTVDFGGGAAVSSLGSESGFVVVLGPQSPSDIVLSANTVAENQPAGTVVGMFSTVDADAGDTQTYSLVGGDGAAENGSFTIVGNELRTAATFDYEAKGAYSVRVRSTDQAGLFTEKTFSITVAMTSCRFVTVGDPGNASDPATGYGAVDHLYKIGKYEVTIGQYCGFLNAIAQSDPNWCFSQGGMEQNASIRGIERSGVDGSYLYRVMDNQGDSSNRPITYVSLFNAMRFANWMANGQPTGPQGATTTENGAYNVTGLNAGVTDRYVPLNAINPNTGAPPTFSIPTENEWYKAAFYSPALNSGAGGYYLYATQSNVAPGNTVGDLPNQGNYYRDGRLAVTQGSGDYYDGNVLTDVGAFRASGSYYGTYDQSGNVVEWNESGWRGGLFGADEMELRSTTRYGFNSLPTYVGFRLTSPVSAHRPSDVLLASTSIRENQPVGTAVGTFSTVDADAGDAHTYTLLGGDGATDNGSFTIVGNQLQTAARFDYETKNSFSIRVRSTDAGGLSTEKSFTVLVADVNEAPTAIILSPVRIVENQPAGSIAGVLQTVDPDTVIVQIMIFPPPPVFRYSFVPGAGATDNALFQVVNDAALGIDKLVTAVPLGAGNYSVRIRSTDPGGLFTEQVFTITVEDVQADALAVQEVVSPDPGVYALGQRMEFTVVLSKPVEVRGRPQMQFLVGRSTRLASYVVGSGSNELTFEYIVTSRDHAASVAVGQRFVFPRRSAIVAGAEVLAAQLPAGIAGVVCAGVTIDTRPPTVVGRVRVPQNGTYVVGQPLDFTVRYSEVVVVEGMPQIPLQGMEGARAAEYLSGAGTPELTFRYVVQAGDRIRSTSGLRLGRTIETGADGFISDEAGNEAAVRITAPALRGIRIDGVPIVVAALLGDQASNPRSKQVWKPFAFRQTP